jgi:hypothetical protein
VEEFIYDIRHNVYITCFILKEKLSRNKTTRHGIIRYNGAGHKAEVYADSVIDIYARFCKEY